MQNHPLNKRSGLKILTPLLLGLAPTLSAPPAAADPSPPIRPGIEVLLTDQIALVQGKRLGLVKGLFGPRTGRNYAGVHMVVQDAHALRPLQTALAALVWLRQTYPKEFAITNPKHFLRIWGSAAVAAGLKAGWSQERIEATWAVELKEFGRVREKHLLYAESSSGGR